MKKNNIGWNTDKKSNLKRRTSHPADKDGNEEKIEGFYEKLPLKSADGNFYHMSSCSRNWISVKGKEVKVILFDIQNFWNAWIRITRTKYCSTLTYRHIAGCLVICNSGCIALLNYCDKQSEKNTIAKTIIAFELKNLIFCLLFNIFKSNSFQY